MTATVLTPYVKASQPSTDDLLSMRRYLDAELRKLSIAIATLDTAVVQLQKDVTAASAFPIVLT